MSSGLDAEPSYLVIGPVALDLDGQGSVQLQNPDATVHELQLRLSSAPDEDLALPDFQLVDPGVATLAPGERLDLEIRFAPSTGLAVEGFLLVGPGAPPELVVPLTGLVDPDGDDDGAAHLLAGGDDCADQDASIGPAMAETWYDGTDQDCDGNDDDADLDGSPVGEDCDDQDPERAPSLAETWYDGTDQDCDGNDDDADLDGFSGVGDDCDDGDPEVHPGHADGGDGVDQDCDGITDEDAALPGAALFTELFPENPSKPTGSDEYLEIYLRDVGGVQGWQLASAAATGNITQRSPAKDGWLLLCSAGLSDDQPDCGAIVEPWPRIERDRDGLRLLAAGAEVDGLGWDPSWGLEGQSLQLDRGLVFSPDDGTCNDSAGAWCALASSPAAINLACP